MKTLKFCFGIGLFLFLPAIHPVDGLKAQNTPDTVQSGKTLPDVHYDVKKEFDENGNLTRYDSVYTWSWTGGDTTLRHFEGNDQMLKQFFGSDSFDNDSIFTWHDSMFPDFEKQFEQMNQMMEEQMKMMEEMQKQFFVPQEEQGQTEEHKKEETENKGVSL